jgi:maltokinase
MDSTLACLAAWMPRQRWYAAKGRPPSLRLVSWWDLESDPADAGDVRVRVYLVADEGSLPTVVYQIPIVARATASVDAASDHIVGSPEPGTTFIDGPFDPAYTRALLRMVTEGTTASGPRTTAVGRPELDAPRGGGWATSVTSAASTPSATVMTGEQSNTSLVYATAPVPVICKIYRQLHPGLNPDIELAGALAASGSPHVPRAVGWIEGTWPDLATAQGTVTGSLAAAQEFLPDVEDAWRVALRAAAAGDDFRSSADALGAATADVHLSLAALFPTSVASSADREATAATWHRRLTIAIAEVPAIAEQRAGIVSVYERAANGAWPALQRVHGDYHLGQVLCVPGRGWMLIDFEGEPLRPMLERTGVDLALRDVAGMLRSFDYVAGSIRRDEPDRPPEAVRAWAGHARGAFLEGYARTSGVHLDTADPLLAALELDKAVYEAIYEARNRPTWVGIPLRAIERLVRRPAPVL